MAGFLKFRGDLEIWRFEIFAGIRKFRLLKGLHVFLVSVGILKTATFRKTQFFCQELAAKC
jgi:hypothetical protein